jgi:hypothetical protein
LHDQITDFKELKRSDGPFDTNYIKNATREELGDDECAIQLFDFFHDYNWGTFVDFFMNNQQSMHETNRDKFKELLLFMAPIIKACKTFLDEHPDMANFTWEGEGYTYVERILAIVGDVDSVTPKIIKFPRFDYEMMVVVYYNTCDAFSAHYRSAQKLSIFSKHMCDSMIESCDWEGKEYEKCIVNFIRGENDYGSCHMEDVFPNW